MGWATIRLAVVTGAILAYGVAAPAPVALAGDAAQDRAVAAIEAMGGRVERGEGQTGVVSADLSGIKVTDAGLAHLVGLEGMIALHRNVAESGVTDAGLAHLAGFKGLQDLHLSGVGITDAGLAHLASLQGLRELYLDSTM